MRSALVSPPAVFLAAPDQTSAFVPVSFILLVKIFALGYTGQEKWRWCFLTALAMW